MGKKRDTDKDAEPVTDSVGSTESRSVADTDPFGATMPVDGPEPTEPRSVADTDPFSATMPVDTSDAAAADARPDAGFDMPRGGVAPVPMSPADAPTASTRTYPSGTKIGRYVCLEQVGVGGMGIVLSAYDPELDRKLAIKLLRPDAPSGTKAEVNRMRLLREAQAMARLSHPNVIAVHDVGTFEDQVFVAMEYIDGGTVKQWLRDKRPPWSERLDAMRRAGRGLAAAHAAGLVHRDFKLDNVMLGRDGRIRVMDFGLARGVKNTDEPAPDVERVDLEAVHTVSALTQTGALMGTPAYMAPEQFLGRPADLRTDQFSFCAALFEALYGMRPFRGDSLWELLAEIQAGNIRPPSKDTEVPKWVHKVVVRGMSTDPMHRYPSLDVLLDALDRDPAKIRRRWLMAVGLVAVVVAGGFLYVDAQRRRAQLCTGASARLESIWDLNRKQAVERAILATGVAYAKQAWNTVSRHLNRYSDEWVKMVGENCLASRIQGVQSIAMMDRRTLCLERRRSELGALTRLLARADASIVANAVEAAQALTPIGSCADRNALAQSIPPPSAQIAGEVQRIGAVLSDAGALLAAGKYKEGTTLLEAEGPALEATAYSPLVAEAALLLGKLYRKSTRSADASASLERSILEATRAGDDGTAANAWAEAVYVEGFQKADAKRGEHWAKHAMAAVARAGSDATTQARVLSSTGAVYYRGGRYEEALEKWLAAAKLVEAAVGPESLELTDFINNAGVVLWQMGRHDEAEVYHVKALATRTRLLGESHPDTATSLSNLGLVYKGRRNYKTAETYFRRSLAAREAALGPRHNRVAHALNNLGNTLWPQNKLDEAHAAHERALAIRIEVFGEDHPDVGDSWNNLGAVAWKRGRFKEAVDYCRRAIDVWTIRLGKDHPRLAGGLHHMGQAYLALGKLEQARDVLERAVQLREGTTTDALVLVETRFELAKALCRAGEKDRGRGLVGKARQGVVSLGEASVGLLERIAAWAEKNPQCR